MNDSRLERAITFLKDAVDADDEIHMVGLIVAARNELTDVLED